MSHEGGCEHWRAAIVRNAELARAVVEREAMLEEVRAWARKHVDRIPGGLFRILGIEPEDL